MRITVALVATVVSSVVVSAANNNNGTSHAESKAPAPKSSASAVKEPKGSIEALLERYAARNKKAIPTNTVPEDLKQKEEDVDKEEGGKEDDKPAPKDKHSRRNGPNRLDAEKRWVWGTSIIQDGDPTTGLPPPGVNSNGLGSYGVDTPTAMPTAPTFPPLPSSNVQIKVTVTSAKPASITPVATPCKKTSECATFERPANSHYYCDPKQKKCTYLCDSGYTLNPWTKQCQRNTGKANNIPRFVKDVEPNTELHKYLRESEPATAGAHKQRGGHGHGGAHRRWIWGTRIFQDGDTGVPGPGTNANLLSTPAYDVNTPTVQLTAPTFPPLQPGAAVPTPAAQVPQQQQQVPPAIRPASSVSAPSGSKKVKASGVPKNSTEAAGKVIAAVMASMSEAAKLAKASPVALPVAPVPVVAGTGKMVKRGSDHKIKKIFPTAMNDHVEKRSAKETRSVDISEEVVDDGAEDADEFDGGEYVETWEDIVILEDKK
ncbi:hypothetical protein ACM66B_006590 [Microbotryomycetes sp. NB124-2]